MDKLSELGTARGHAERRVALAEAELAEAKKELGRCTGAYIDYVKLHPTKGIEKCWCGKTFFWQDAAARETWVREHVHAM